MYNAPHEIMIPLECNLTEKRLLKIDATFTHSPTGFRFIGIRSESGQRRIVMVAECDHSPWKLFNWLRKTGKLDQVDYLMLSKRGA